MWLKKHKNISKFPDSNEYYLFLTVTLTYSAVLQLLSCDTVLRWKFLGKSLWPMIVSCFWTQTKSLNLINLLDLSLKDFGYFQNKIHSLFSYQMKELSATLYRGLYWINVLSLSSWMFIPILWGAIESRGRCRAESLYRM